MDVKALIRDARLPEETVPICLRADLVAEFERVERQLDEAQKRPTDSLAGNGARRLAEQLEELREQMAGSTIEFVLRAMPKRRWQEFVAQHPPRKDGDDVHPKDVVLGINTVTFWPALVRASVVAPELDDEDWAALLGDDDTDGTLTHHQFFLLANAAWALNKSGTDIPFSFAASQILNSDPE